MTSSKLMIEYYQYLICSEFSDQCNVFIITRFFIRNILWETLGGTFANVKKHLRKIKAQNIWQA